MNSPLTQYDSAKRMLHQAARVDEVMHVRDFAERMALYGKQAKDRDLMADAMEIQTRAERKLGELLIKAHEAGQISRGGRKPRETVPSPETGTEAEPVLVVTLAGIGIDKKLSASAQKLAQTDEAVFEAALVRSREKIIAGAAAVVNPKKDVSTADKKAARAEKEQRLGARQRALPEARFGVIYADPEWQLEAYSDNGMSRSAANHYPVSSLDEIRKRDAGSLAAEDCVLFLWATVPMLPQALDVMAAWGFTYKSHIVWRKAEHPGAGVVLGTGYWFRNGHELLLVGTRGNLLPAPAPGTQWPSIFDAPPRKHSEKPDQAYELIEQYFPTLPKIELNARRARDGWVRWGFEAPEDDVPGRVVGNPMATAPKDGSTIWIRFEHPNIQYAEGDAKERWQEVCEAYWTEFNGGGWVWHGIAGRPTAWWPKTVALELCHYVPPPDESRAKASVGNGEISAPLEGALTSGDASRLAAGRTAVDLEPAANKHADPLRSGAAAREDAAPPAPGAYEAALAEALRTIKPGGFFRNTAAPVLAAAYATDPVIPTKRLAADLGHPVGTILVWASREGLTRSDRRGGPNHIGQKQETTDA